MRSSRRPALEERWRERGCWLGGRGRESGEVGNDGLGEDRGRFGGDGGGREYGVKFGGKSGESGEGSVGDGSEGSGEGGEVREGKLGVRVGCRAIEVSDWRVNEAKK